MTADHALSGRRVVITGAGRGLGRALAIVMADEGAEVVLWGRDSGKLRGVAEVVRARTRRSAETVPCDLGQPKGVREACRRTLSEERVVDVLVNNGSPFLSGKLDEVSESDIDTTVRAAVTGTILVTQGLLPGLRRSSAADVVTIVSTSGLPGAPFDSTAVAFTAAKYAQSGLSAHLRAELKPLGIRVTAIYPPDFDDTDPLSPGWTQVRGPSSRKALTNREVVAAVLFAVTAPRVVAYSEIVLGNMWRD